MCGMITHKDYAHNLPTHNIFLGSAVHADVCTS